MRALVSRTGLGARSRGLFLPSSVVCAALIFGPVGTAVAVTDASRDLYASTGADPLWSFTPTTPSTPSVLAPASASSTPSTPSAYADRTLKRLAALERADRSDLLTPVLNVLTTSPSRRAPAA